MDDSDTTAILPDDELSYKNDETSANDTFNHQNEAEEERNSLKPPFSCPLSVSVEPVLFLSMFSVALQMPLSTQYLWDRISEDLGYNGSRAGGCGNTSGIPDPLEKEVKAMTAHWNLYINLGGFAVGLFVVTLLGSWSDLRGRRPVLILPNLGMALQASVYLLVMYLKLPVAWFFLGRLLSGLSGDFNAILAGCFAYVADTSDRGSRTFRVAVLEACLGLAGMLASIIGGQWRKAQGYKNPFWLVLAINLATALYAYLFVPESVTLDPSAKLFTPRHHRAVYRLYSTGGSTSQGDRKFHRYKLWLYTLCFFIVVTVHFGSRELFVLYELSAPLCWGSALIGYGSAAQHLTYMSSLLGLKVMQRCLEDSWVALVGLASNMAGLVVISVANTTVLMFTGYGVCFLAMASTPVLRSKLSKVLSVVPLLLLGYGVCFLAMASTPVLRSKLSKLVDPSEQGALFASVACVEGLCSLVASGIFNSLYPATLHVMKGFPFIFAAILLLIPTGVMGVLELKSQKRNTQDHSTTS